VQRRPKAVPPSWSSRAHGARFECQASDASTAPGKWRNGIGSVLGMKRSATVLIFDRGGGNISREPLS
jgi:hypothetical protein